MIEFKSNAALAEIKASVHEVLLSLKANGQTFADGDDVSWSFRSGTGYGKVLHKTGPDEDNADNQRYLLHVYYRHRSADGTLEPATRTHLGGTLRHDANAKAHARAEFNKFKGTSREGVLAL